MKNNNNFVLRQNDKADYPAMFEIWEEAVKATHHFLSKSDIFKIGIQVKEYLANSTLVVVTDQNNTLLGFMGMTENKIDSLFVHPKYFGKGVGKFFIQHASSLFLELLVDVNEDNEQAKLFYEKMGFRVFNRNELDDDGRPFPILNMMKSSLF